MRMHLHMQTLAQDDASASGSAPSGDVLALKQKLKEVVNRINTHLKGGAGAGSA